ncbi:MAG: universal stress protein [Haloglomus sp.]
MSAYDSILVAVDGSDSAEAAARAAVRFADAFDADISGVSAIQKHDISLLSDSETELELDEAAAGAVEDLESRAADAGVACRTVVARGAAHEVISAYTDQLDADLVAMGTHGRTGLDRLLLGSVAERTLRTSDVPVFVTPENAGAPTIDSVLVPTDGSDTAVRAADHGIAVARRFDATVHVVSAVDVRTISAAYETGPAIPEIVAKLESDHRAAVDTVVERAEAHDLDVATAVPQGPPARLLREYADEEDVDLVAMGTHGRSGLERHLIGSTTERLVRTSPAPVVAVPPAE